MAAAIAAIVLPLASTSLYGEGAIEVESPMFDSPDVNAPSPIPVFPSQLKTMWLEALARPEDELKRQAAETIAMAYQGGMTELADTVDELAAVLGEENQHPVVRLAVARTLIVLNARDQSALLLDEAKQGPLDLALLVESTLADWDYEPLHDAWLERLQSGGSRTLLLHAIRGLGEAEVTAAAETLEQLAMSQNNSAAVRLEAARSLGKLQNSGLLEQARRLLADKSQAGLVDRLVAVAFLQRHSGDETVATLNEIANDSEPAVVAGALERLYELDPELLMPRIGSIIADPDTNVRFWGARTLAALPSEENLDRIAPLLNDPDTGLRVFVRDALLTAAGETDHGEQIRNLAVDVLAGDTWQGLEQSALLLAALDHEPAAERMLELVDHERSEAYIAAAWGLRKLAVESLLPDMLEAAIRVARRIGTSETIHQHDQQLAQLYQAFGEMKYQPAEELLSRWIGRGAKGIRSRAAAIWSLGLIHEDDVQPNLAQKLEERIDDVDSVPPEDPFIRRISAIGLGRMKAEEFTDVLERYQGWHDQVGVASLWALSQIRDEPMPEPEPAERVQSGWFVDVVN